MHKEIPKTAAKIKLILKPIIGEPLSDMWKPLFQVFEFGEQTPFKNRYGRDATRAFYTIDVYPSACPWSISLKNVVILGSHDFRNKRKFFDRKTPPNDKTKRKRWQDANNFFVQLRAQTLFVSKIVVRESGAVTISLKQGYTLELLPVISEEAELWWFRNRINRRTYEITTNSMTEFVHTDDVID